jgi:predicted RND superfamily exporter protein
VEVRQTDNDFATCARITIQEMSKTCFLTLATTAIGFGSLLVAHAELLQSLALQAAMGMMCCYVCLMAVLPATLVLCGSRLCPHRCSAISSESIVAATDNASHTVVNSRLDNFWTSLGAFISRHAAAIVLLHLLLAGWTLWSSRNIPINSYMFETYDSDHPTMDAVRIMDDRMSGLISLEVQLRARDASRVFDEEVAAALSKLRQQIPQDERVTFYRDYVEFLSVFDHGRTITDDSTAAADSLRRVQLALKQLDDPAVTSAFLGKDEPVARVMMRIRDVGSAGMKDLIKSVTQNLKQQLPNDIQFTLTGDAYLHAVCMDAFVRDLFYSLIAASGVIFMLITVLFRSLRIGLISAIPNMLPLFMTLGYMHLRGYEMTAGNVIVFAISLGIAVDDTIHFLARFRDERKSVSSQEAIQGTLSTSGRAIVLTSVLVVSGLSVLTFSDFVPTRRFAELTAITMCTALPGDLMLLPALLALFGGGTAAAVTDDPE